MINNNPKDKFDEKLKQKLEFHPVSVDENIWNKIDRKLYPKKKKVVLWLWISGITAVVFIALLLNRGYVRNDNVYNQTYNQIGVVRSEKKIDNILSDSYQLAKENFYEEEQDFLLNPDTSSEKIKEEKLIQNKDISTFENKEKIIESSNPDLLAEEKKDIENKPENKQEKEKQFLQKYFSIENKEYANNHIKRQKNNDWQIAINVASVNTSSMNNQGYNVMNNNSGDKSGETEIGNEILADINYSPPLSFGLTLRKNLNKRLAVETGLVYTYLQTDFNFPENQQRAISELHYLGLQTNAIFRIWNNSDWDVYISAGPMLEKGIHSRYKQKKYQKVTNSMHTTEVSSNISGVQWSAGASAGVSYKFYQNFGIYVEPRFSYYFDNNQPFSIRTEKPFVFGLSAGLKYDF